jgi:hypothetical protein
MPILDLYDDPSASVLRHQLGRAPLPAKLASMQVDTPELLERLPDRLFALVGSVDGERLRKYAMHDAGHLATSIVYFLRCGDQLPDNVRAKVAENLVEACRWYDTEAPEALQKVALLGAVGAGLTLLDAPNVLRKHRAAATASDEALRTVQSGPKLAAHHRQTYSVDEASVQLDRFIRGLSDDPEEEYAAHGGAQYPNPFAASPGVKEANLVGTEVMAPAPAGPGDPRGQSPHRRFAQAAKVSTDLGSFHLVERAEPAPEVVHYALPHRELYPIDTQSQVKRASAYYAEYQHEFAPEDRRVFAQSVAARAEELGVPLGGALAKIAGNEYGPHIRNELAARIRGCEGTDKTAAYEVLLERIDEISPLVMVDLLKTADQETGVDASYGKPVVGYREPLSAVFGAPEKPIYSWNGQGHYVTEEQLRSYAKRTPDLDRIFGDGYSTKFIEDPIKQFDKLSDDKKIVLARLANQEAFRLV